MNKNKRKKAKRFQPRPKHKRQPTQMKTDVNASHCLAKIRELSRSILNNLADKERVNAYISESIDKIESYFRKYDSVQLLGSAVLYMIDNTPNIEKFYSEYITSNPLKLDEYAEVMVEYAYNFALSMPNNGKDTPTDEVVIELRETLRGLIKTYALIDMPQDNDANQWIKWILHSETISIRGDGYQQHTQEVFNELFIPHSDYFKQKYGFGIEELHQFCTTIENKIICKIGTLYGIYKLWQRWREWEDKKGGNKNDVDIFVERDFSNGIMTEFIKANPDVFCPEEPSRCLVCQPDDYTGSKNIFWVVPQNETEKMILETLSCEFGSNEKFIEEGDYRGNIMNGYNIFIKPILKDEGKYYCFTPMLIYRNLFLITERLIMADNAYYQKHYNPNTSRISRDNYIENKVRLLLEKLLPTVSFYSGVHYKIIENGIEKKPELDILGVSTRATYIVEVKAHELTYKDRVGVEGAKQKFRNSVEEACSQSNRAKVSINTNVTPVFSSKKGVFPIDKSRPIYKIAVCFQHYSTLLGDFNKLLAADMLKEEYRDTWIVSLFDLMVVADFIEDEEEFIKYLNMHNEIYRKGFVFTDEIELLNGFLNYNLEDSVKRLDGGRIAYGTKEIDEEYAQDFKLDFQLPPKWPIDER